MANATHQEPRQRVWATAALLCNVVVRSGDSKALLGVFDGLLVVPALVPGGRIKAEFFMTLVAEAVPDPVEHEFVLYATRPDGRREQIGEGPVRFSVDAPGRDFSSPIAIPIDQSGPIWFDVVLDGQLLTRSRVQVDHVIVGESTPEEAFDPPLSGPTDPRLKR